MARCESSHFFVCLYKKFPAKRTVGLLVVREGVKGKEEFIMEYYENDWDMYWDIVEDMYSNLSEEELERRKYLIISRKMLLNISLLMKN